MPPDAMRARALAAAQALVAAGAVPTAEAVAAAIGLSRATYYRLVGSGHEALIREAGYQVEPSARERLLTAASALLNEVGLAELVMDAVAERAGVSRATLYRLFPGKAELISALVADRAPVGQLRQVLVALIDQPPEAVLPPLLQVVTPQLWEARGLLRTLLAEPDRSGPVAVGPRALFQEFCALLLQYLSAQMQAGRLRAMDPRLALQSLVGPLLLYATGRPDFWAALGGPLPPLEEGIAALVQVWLRGMRPDQDGPLHA